MTKANKSEMTNYFIKSFNAENFRMFSKISVKFNEKFNFITGPNGCGKSSILTGIHHCLHHDFNSSRLTSESSFHIEVVNGGELIFLGLAKESFREGNAYRETQMKNWFPPRIENVTQPYRVFVPDGQNKEIIPLFLGTKRSIDYVRVQGAQREEPRQNSIDIIDKEILNIVIQMLSNGLSIDISILIKIGHTRKRLIGIFCLKTYQELLLREVISNI